MNRKERLTCVAGGILGAIVSYALLVRAVDLEVPWVAASTGGIVGGFFGAFGQNFIEGLVICVICTSLIALSLPLSPSLPSWVTESFIGFFVGAALGSFCHGCGEFLPESWNQQTRR